MNRNHKNYFWIAIVFCAICYLIYDYFTCYTSIINQLYFQNKSIIDKKYLYYIRSNGSIDISVECIWTCRNGKLDSLNAYYNEKTKSLDYFDNWLKPGREIEVLDYNLKESVAAVKIYNTESKRLQREGFVIVSMKCLHDTLPSSLK